jgi:predicted transcriptional regulator
MDGLKMTPLWQAVYDYALTRADFTDWELCQHFGNHGSTYRTRRSELVRMGLLRKTERRRPNGKGNREVVWTATALDERVT